MRIAVIDWYYQPVLDGLYAKHPALAEEPYAAQLHRVMSLRFGTADAYSFHLKQLGHEAAEMVVNCEPLQRRWAHEHGEVRLLRRAPVPKRGTAHKAATYLLGRQVLLRQLEEYDPDVAMVQRLEVLTAADLRRLRRKGVFLVAHLGALAPRRRLRHYDLIVTLMPHLVRQLRALGLRAEYQPAAFYQQVANQLQNEGLAPDPTSPTRDLPLTFVGAVHGESVQRGGIERLERISQELGIRLWGSVPATVRPDSPIHRHHQGEAWGLEMYRVMARTRVALNRHGDIAGGYACNMRLFEATGMGAMVLTESSKNLPGLFEPGVELVTYDTTEDLLEKARYYLEHDDERRAIAKAGQGRTLAEHTYGHRMARLSDLLQAYAG